MKIGVIIPTAGEAVGFPSGIPSAVGFGPGKTATCAAAAKLLFQEKCDGILVWGTAGTYRRELQIGSLLAAREVAYSDYDVAPLFGSDGMGFVPKYGEKCWMKCHPGLTDILVADLREIFPERQLGLGRISAGDVFNNAKYYRADNRIENATDAVDMESPAVVHFCRIAEEILGHGIPVAVIRLVSNYIGGDAAEEFQDTLKILPELNARLGRYLLAKQFPTLEK